MLPKDSHRGQVVSDRCETHAQSAHDHRLADGFRRGRARGDELQGVHADKAQRNSGATDSEHATDVQFTAKRHLNTVEDGNGQDEDVKVQ